MRISDWSSDVCSSDLNHPERQRDENCRYHQRYRDESQFLPAVLHVQFGRIEDLLVERFQTYKRQQKDEGGPVPDINDDDRHQGEAWIAKPVHLWQTHKAEERIDHTKIEAKERKSDV